ncbi:hypothetical protein HOY82DRAFT_599502 [Tuber indicum]|nr:hypothetical protein HOY82DRAFT_599502 [Tuber indicum]
MTGRNMGFPRTTGRKDSATKESMRSDLLCNINLEQPQYKQPQSDGHNGHSVENQKASAKLESINSEFALLNYKFESLNHRLERFNYKLESIDTKIERILVPPCFWQLAVITGGLALVGFIIGGFVDPSLLMTTESSHKSATHLGHGHHKVDTPPASIPGSTIARPPTSF